jgi:hypothetical protein
MTPLAAAPKVGDPLAFYEVAAAVIPVLYLAIVFQTRSFRQSPKESPFTLEAFILRNAVLLMVLVAFVGEFDALNVLASQHPGTTARHGVSISLFVLGMGLVIEPLLSISRALDKGLAKDLAEAKAAGHTGLVVELLRFRSSIAVIAVIAVGTVIGILLIV